jgi:hypothetical protein
MIRVLTSLPRPVLISAATLAGVLAVFAILLPVLGGARDGAFAEHNRLNGEIARVNTAISQAKSDIEFVAANKEKFEALLESDRLIPHTRRAATMELESTARLNGVTSLSYNIAAAAAPTSAKAVSSQPTSGAYRVSVEDIAMKVAAPLDGSIYRFMTDLTDQFPGSAVVQSFSLSRGAKSGFGDLSSQDSVAGDIEVSWRTAQAEEKKETESAKK